MTPFDTATARPVYVQRPVFDEFTARLADRAGELAYGWPADEATANMPLISAGHRRKVLGCYDLARAEGAEVLTGGGTPTFSTTPGWSPSSSTAPRWARRSSSTRGTCRAAPGSTGGWPAG